MRSQECRDAAARYERGRQWDILCGRPRTVDAVGVRRRIEALWCLGWSNAAIGRAVSPPVKEQVVWKWRRANTVNRSTLDRMAAVFEQLCMRVPDPVTTADRIAVAKTRSLARRRNYAPPLAWDNIDDPAEVPSTAADTRVDVDEVAVQRALSGQRTGCTRVERLEVASRWKAAGKPLDELDRLQGWNIRRDMRAGRAA